MLTYVVLLGCGAETPDPGREAGPSGATSSGDASLVLASRSTRGGLCASGVECRSSLTIRGDGRWTSLDGSDTEDGTIDDETLDSLRTAIARTRLDQAPPATGCATAADGTEVVYTWRDESGTEVEVSSCERAILDDDPLVAWFTGLEAAG